MQTETEFRAILVADCGMERTRVMLVDLVGEDAYRLVAQQEVPSTVEPPLSDVTIAIREAIAELERTTGRQLLQDAQLRIPQSRDGQGVDAFLATCSAGGALPVLVLAVTADITAQSAQRAVEGNYAVPFRTVTMEQVLREDPLSGKEEPGSDPWWKALEGLYPGCLLMVGGVDSGNIAPLRTLARALAEALPPLPTRLEQEVTQPALVVVYAGNQRAQEAVREQLADRVDLRIVDNVRPQLRQEQLLPARQGIARLYEEQILQRIAGYEGLASWAQGPVQLPHVGLQLAARFLATHHQRQVLAVDLGSGATAITRAEGEQCARVVLGHFGLGYGIGHVLARRGEARIRRWLPFPISAEEIRDWVLNQALRPRTLPTTVRDFLLQQAVAREAISEAAARLRNEVPITFELALASGGGLARAPRLSQVALMLLDALEPTGENPSGLVDLYLDRFCLVPSCGALATVNPDAAACVLLQDGLFHLGPCLTLLGRGKKGAPAAVLELEFVNGMRRQVEVCWGELTATSFPWGNEAHLTVHPARGASVGLGRSRERLTTRDGERIRGGALGLIVDARGRPLELSSDEEERQRTLRDWLEGFGAYTAEELAGLVPVQPPEEGPLVEKVPPEAWRPREKTLTRSLR